MASIIKRLVSGADFWDEEENRRQRQQYAAPKNVQPQARSTMNVGVARPQGNMVVNRPQPQQPKVNVVNPLQFSLSKTAPAPSQPLRVGNKTIQNTTSIRPAEPIKSPLSKPSAFDRGVASVGAGVLRSGTGMVQGASGLYDLASPGTGTNRLSKRADNAAVNLDRAAKNLENPIAYKGGQLATEILGFKGAGAVGKQVATRSPQVIKNANTSLNKGVTNATQAMLQSGTKGRIAANTLRTTARPTNLAAEAAITGRFIGEDASKGREITPQRIATDIAIGGAFNLGVPLAGNLIKEGVQKVTPIVKGALQQSPKLPAPRVSMNEQAILRDYSDALVGANKAQGQELSDIIAQARQVGSKHGIDITNGSVAERLERTNSVLDQVGKTRKASLFQNEGGYLGADEGPKVPLRKNLEGTQTARSGKQLSSSSNDQRATITLSTPEISPQRATQPLQGAQQASYQRKAGTAATDRPTNTLSRKDAQSSKDNVLRIFNGAEISVGTKTPLVAQQRSKAQPYLTQQTQKVPNSLETVNRSARQSGRQTEALDTPVPIDRTSANYTTEVDTTQYVKEMDKAQKSAMKGDRGVKEKASDFKEKFIDDLAPIEDRLNRAIKNGADVDPKDHITYQLDRSRRAEGVTHAYIRDNGLDRIIQDVPSTKEFDQYLIARHAKELDPEITTGRNAAKDAALVKQFDSKYAEQAKQLYAYNKKLLDTSVEYGLISKETATKLKKKYPDYVPFNRIFNEDELANLYGGAGKGNASISKQTSVQKLKGSQRVISSPLNSIIDKTRVVVEQGERNRAAQMLAGYKDLPGNPFNLKEIKANETIGSRSTISYLDNGVKRTFEVDKEIADAAKNMTRQDIGLWGRIAAVPARVLRGGATTVNVGFAGANIVKDVVGAAINSKHSLRIAEPQAVGKALAAALKHNGKSYQELMREGVSGTSFDMFRNPLKTNVSELRSHKNIGTRAAYNISHPSQWYRTIENTIGRSEDFGRALQYYSNKAGFESKLGKGSNEAKILAADQARHNSTNFFRHGSYGKGVNLAIPYWNAGVQGARIQARRIKERPAQTLGKIGLAIAAPSATIAVNNYSDEKRREIMDNIPEYEKQGNIIILGPNPTYNKDTNKWEGVYKFPVPPQHLGIHSAVQDAVRSGLTGEAFDGVKNVGKVAENYTTINPTSARETANRYIPQAVKLIAEPMTNMNFFTGNKIVPDSQKNLPAKDQSSDYTSGTAKTIGKVTNTSPRQIDNAIRSGMGGAGQNLVYGLDKALAAVGAIDKKDVRGQNPIDSVTRRFSGASAISPSDKAEKQFKQMKKEVTESEAYKTASQYDKSRMLNRLETDLSAVAWNQSGKSDKKLTKKQKALDGGFSTENYTNLESEELDLPKDMNGHDVATLTRFKGMSDEEKDNTIRTESDAEYKLELAEFERDKKQGKLSRVEEMKRSKELKRHKAGSTFNKDIREFYSLSKTEIENYITSNDDGEEVAKNLLAYGDALVKEGAITKNKFRNSKGAVSFGTKKSGKGKKATASDFSKAFNLPDIGSAKTASISVPKVNAPSFKKARKPIPKIGRTKVATPKVTKLRA